MVEKKHNRLNARKTALLYGWSASKDPEIVELLRSGTYAKIVERVKADLEIDVAPSSIGYMVKMSVDPATGLDAYGRKARALAHKKEIAGKDLPDPMWESIKALPGKLDDLDHFIKGGGLRSVVETIVREMLEEGDGDGSTGG